MTDTLRERLADELAAADHGRSSELSTEYCRRVYGPLADAALAFIAAWALEPAQVERAARMRFLQQHSIMHDHAKHWRQVNREIERDCMSAALAALFKVKP